MRTEELVRKVMDLVKDTQAEKIKWEILCQTSEYQEEATKKKETIDGSEWIVDECFVSYYCMHKEKEFLMITYEKICRKDTETRSVNLVFLPPLGLRFFDLDRLAEYAVNTNQILIYDIHMLWLTIMEKYKKNKELVRLEVTAR